MSKCPFDESIIPESNFLSLLHSGQDWQSEKSAMDNKGTMYGDGVSSDGTGSDGSTSSGSMSIPAFITVDNVAGENIKVSEKSSSLDMEMPAGNSKSIPMPSGKDMYTFSAKGSDSNEPLMINGETELNVKDGAAPTSMVVHKKGMQFIKFWLN